ncbi:MAG: porin [Burkholderiaceae bacterium]|nr:porin [Burkholderiaceae bacterium]
MILKKTLCSLAILAAFASGSAHAQSSVTLYGIVDAGIMTQNNSGTPSAGRTTSFVDAQILPSVYGMKGTEDLGDGLKAGFNLEGGFNVGNGTHNSPGVYQTQIFGREAKVTLGGEWGTVGAGLQVDPGIIASIATEPRGLTDSFSMLEYWILATVGNNTAGGGALQGGIFDQNSVTYTYTKNGLYVGLEYGFGGVAGNNSANRTESIGVSYSLAGFVASGSYAKANNANPADGGTSSQIDVFGLGYDFGNVALRGQYGEFKSNYVGGNAASDVKSWGVGVDWKTSIGNKINLSYYDAKDDGIIGGGKTTEIALLDVLALSKRTQLYGQFAIVKADANAGISSFIGGVGAYTAAVNSAGNTTNYFGFGLQHEF